MQNNEEKEEFKDLSIRNKDPEPKILDLFWEYHAGSRRRIMILFYLASILGSILLLFGSSIKSLRFIPILFIIGGIIGIITYKKKKFSDAFVPLMVTAHFCWYVYFRNMPDEIESRYTHYTRGLNMGITQALALFLMYKNYQIYFVGIGFSVIKIIIFSALGGISIDALLFNLSNDIIILIAKIFIDRTEMKVFIENHRKRESLEKFQKFLKYIIPTGIAVIDPSNDKILFANNSMKKQFGCEFKSQISDIIKSLIIEVGNITNRLIEDEKCNLLDYIKENQYLISKPKKLLCYYSQHEIKYQLEITIFPFDWDEKKTIGVIASDVTNQIEIWSLKRSNESKEMAISTVAHELRNPLSGLLGSVETISKELTDSRLKNLLLILRGNISYMLNLLNSILDLQQLKSNRLTLNNDKFYANEAFESIKLLFDFQINLKKIKFITSIDPEFPQFIITDKDRLTQILVNLCSNAIKFTSEGSITLSAQKFDNHLEFSVKDTGIGISPEDCKKLFNAFSKLEHGSSLNQKGVGLGLMISNSLVKILTEDEKSHIKVNSKIGEGTKFYFTLPILRSSQCVSINDELNSIDLQKYVKTPFKSKELRLYSETGEDKNLISELKTDLFSNTQNFKTILIVDDDSFNIYALQELISDLGYECKYAHNGSEAVKMIESIYRNGNKISLVFMDSEMPIMDGKTASAKLNEMMRLNIIGEFSIIGCTGNTDQRILNECLKSGMKECVTKPIRKKEVERIIEKYVN